MSSLRLDLLWRTMLFCNLCGDVVSRELCYVDSNTGDEMYCEDLECCGSNPIYCCDKQSFLIRSAVWGSVGVLFIASFATCWICKARKSRRKKAAMKASIEAKMKKMQPKASPPPAATANPTAATSNTTASANTSATAAAAAVGKPDAAAAAAATVFVISESVSGEGVGRVGVVNQGFTHNEPPEVSGNVATTTTTTTNNNNTTPSPSATYHHQQRDGGSSNMSSSNMSSSKMSSSNMSSSNMSSSSPPQTLGVTDREGRHLTSLVEMSPSPSTPTPTPTTTPTSFRSPSPPLPPLPSPLSNSGEQSSATTMVMTTTTTTEIVASDPFPDETIYGQQHYPPPATPTLPAQVIHVSESPHTVG